MERSCGACCLIKGGQRPTLVRTRKLTGPWPSVPTWPQSTSCGSTPEVIGAEVGQPLQRRIDLAFSGDEGVEGHAIPVFPLCFDPLSFLHRLPSPAPAVPVPMLGSGTSSSHSSRRAPSGAPPLGAGSFGHPMGVREPFVRIPIAPPVAPFGTFFPDVRHSPEPQGIWAIPAIDSYAAPKARFGPFFCLFSAGFSDAWSGPLGVDRLRKGI